MLSTPSRPENETAGNELTHLGIGVAGMLPRIDASEPGCPPVRLDHFGSPRLARLASTNRCR
jgi:hypothetical protein